MLFLNLKKKLGALITDFWRNLNAVFIFVYNKLFWSILIVYHSFKINKNENVLWRNYIIYENRFSGTTLVHAIQTWNSFKMFFDQKSSDLFKEEWNTSIMWRTFYRNKKWKWLFIDNSFLFEIKCFAKLSQLKDRLAILGSCVLFCTGFAFDLKFYTCNFRANVIDFEMF